MLCHFRGNSETRSAPPRCSATRWRNASAFDTALAVATPCALHAASLQFKWDETEQLATAH
eukprot:15601565-Heterocapsa_arctica.AAC.1